MCSGCPPQEDLNCTLECPNGSEGFETGEDGCEQCKCKPGKTSYSLSLGKIYINTKDNREKF